MRILLLFILFTFSSCLANPKVSLIVIEKREPITQFDSILHAFIQVESEDRATVVNPLSGATGVLQLMPIMVEEANRICKLTGNPARFNYSDRQDSIKSVIIWNIIMAYKNPEYSVDKCINIWNPNHSEDYVCKIKKHL